MPSTIFKAFTLGNIGKIYKNNKLDEAELYLRKVNRIPT